MHALGRWDNTGTRGDTMLLHDITLDLATEVPFIFVTAVKKIHSREDYDVLDITSSFTLKFLKTHILPPNECLSNRFQGY